MANRIRTCPECGNQFTFGPGRGQARRYCGETCAKANATRRRAEQAPVCSVDGCERRARSVASEYCETHYYRIRRNGTLKLKAETSPPPSLTVHSSGYLMQYLPGHPLQTACGARVYQHRAVHFDAHGRGPFSCHWCGKEVGWHDMDVDHVNAVRDDNRLSNLVASCHPCNTRRGVEKMTATCRARSKAKLSYNGETLTLGEWAARIGISRTSLDWRLKNGWEIGRALSEPRGVTEPR